MPAATTHVEFAKDVLRTNKNLEQQIKDKQLFWLGSQGPDMLFFSHLSCLPGSLHKYGNLMHNSKVYEVIHFFEQYAGNDQDLKSYIMGYLCHYALDSTAHPLIFAMTDAKYKAHGGISGSIHVGLESDIDAWILHQRGRTIYDYDVYRYLDIPKAKRDKVAVMYQQMFHHVFHLSISTTRISNGIKEVGLWTKWLAPNKKKYDAVYQVEKTMGNNHFLTAMMLYDADPAGAVNLEHHSYIEPWKPHELIRASFPELYGQAVQLAGKLLQSHSKEDFIKNFNGQVIA